MDYHELGNQGGWMTKGTPVKGTAGGSLSWQKSAGARPAEHLLSLSPASAQASMKGKREAMNKHSGKLYKHDKYKFLLPIEILFFLVTYTCYCLNLLYAEAMDFRDWCQSECARLIGTTGIIHNQLPLEFLFEMIQRLMSRPWNISVVFFWECHIFCVVYDQLAG